MKLPKIWAHRGGRKWAPAIPENSLSGFSKCLQMGVYGIEIDVHKCKSGELVVLHGGVHGGDVAHTSNGKGLVKDLTWEELKLLSIGANFADEHKYERFPLLSEVLALLQGQCVLNIEIKNAPWQYAGFADDLIAMIRQYSAEGSVVLSSFDHGILKSIHEKAPQLKLAILIDGLIVDIGEYAKKIGFQCWHPFQGELRIDYVQEAHAAGLEVNVWTANTADEWAQALSLDVDGIVTDDPVGLDQYLKGLANSSQVSAPAATPGPVSETAKTPVLLPVPAAH